MNQPTNLKEELTVLTRTSKDTRWPIQTAFPVALLVYVTLIGLVVGTTELAKYLF